ncbi:MAG: hypothetical protein ABIR66_05215 [Saprospiraceae bacterium]
MVEAPKCPDLPPCNMSVSDSASISMALNPIVSLNSSKIEIQNMNGDKIISYDTKEVKYNGSWFHLNVPEKDAVDKLKLSINNNKKVKFVLMDQDAAGNVVETNYFEITIEPDKSGWARFWSGKH